MKIPFNAGQFFEVFVKYNTYVYPFQLIIIALVLSGLFFLFTKNSSLSKYIGAYLGFLWLWMGIVYHISFFSEINPAAYVFGFAFILQGLLFLISNFKGKLLFSFNHRPGDYGGYFLIFYGLIVYPMLSFIMGDTLKGTISLGLPCPTTVFTFGCLILTRKTLPKYLLIIPLLWSFIGFSAAMLFGVYQDVILPLAAIATCTIIFRSTVVKWFVKVDR